ncbi:MAG: LPS-assembly protein LptD [Synechococcus sp. SB0676_bin_10]|uniref:LPS-assembly protein LptD n=1 Tax=Synechococcus sp. SB0676_bin_10 TaxID=2604869 RepID=A0A6B1F7C4_9SYNE|nr:LPS-assembly protein LptD [Cyanobacteria bacterium MAG IRC3_bin_20]MYG37645.1 LPS-assembly protein LptD [Synechococcus sp. SB0676_bin_10]MYK07220.1 LPS-assembly protein LptD [Synechococcus sp. SB0670_bin_20]
MAINLPWLRSTWLVLLTALAATTVWPGRAQPSHTSSTRSLPSLAQTTGGANPDGQGPAGGRITIRSDQQQMNEAKGVLTAEGRVLITYPAYNLTATADHAQYFTREGRLILSGSVEVRQNGGNSIRGERLVYTEQSRTFVVESKPGEQVHSTYNLSSPHQGGPSP